MQCALKPLQSTDLIFKTNGQETMRLGDLRKDQRRKVTTTYLCNGLPIEGIVDCRTIHPSDRRTATLTSSQPPAPAAAPSKLPLTREQVTDAVYVFDRLCPSTWNEDREKLKHLGNQALRAIEAQEEIDRLRRGLKEIQNAPGGGPGRRIATQLLDRI
jgi:hypothetical protein